MPAMVRDGESGGARLWSSAAALTRCSLKPSARRRRRWHLYRHSHGHAGAPFDRLDEAFSSSVCGACPTTEVQAQTSNDSPSSDGERFGVRSERFWLSASGARVCLGACARTHGRTNARTAGRTPARHTHHARHTCTHTSSPSRPLLTLSLSLTLTPSLSLSLSLARYRSLACSVTRFAASNGQADKKAATGRARKPRDRESDHPSTIPHSAHRGGAAS